MLIRRACCYRRIDRGWRDCLDSKSGRRSVAALAGDAASLVLGLPVPMSLDSQDEYVPGFQLVAASALVDLRVVSLGIGWMFVAEFCHRCRDRSAFAGTAASSLETCCECCLNEMHRQRSVGVGPVLAAPEIVALVTRSCRPAVVTPARRNKTSSSKTQGQGLAVQTCRVAKLQIPSRVRRLVAGPCYPRCWNVAWARAAGADTCLNLVDKFDD